MYIKEQSEGLLALDLLYISYIFLRKCHILWFTRSKVARMTFKDDFLQLSGKAVIALKYFTANLQEDIAYTKLSNNTL